MIGRGQRSHVVVVTPDDAVLAVAELVGADGVAAVEARLHLDGAEPVEATEADLDGRKRRGSWELCAVCPAAGFVDGWVSFP